MDLIGTFLKLYSDLESEAELAQLTSEYHKTRRQLMLWTAVLFCHVLLELKPDDFELIGNKVGAILKMLASRQMLDVALIALIIYFFVRLWITWFQCDPKRRRIMVSRIDMGFSIVVSASGLAVYLFQSLKSIALHNSIFSSVDNWLAILVLNGSWATGLLGIALIFRLTDYQSIHRPHFTRYTYVLLIGITSTTVFLTTWITLLTTISPSWWLGVAAWVVALLTSISPFVESIRFIFFGRKTTTGLLK